MIHILFIGTTELILIAGMALLLFGGKKLPEMMRGLGQGVKQFKEGMKDVNPEEGESAKNLNKDISQPINNLETLQSENPKNESTKK